MSGAPACVADREGSLRVLYISRPAGPREVGPVSFAGHASRGYVLGSMAHVAAGQGDCRS